MGLHAQITGTKTWALFLKEELIPLQHTVKAHYGRGKASLGRWRLSSLTSDHKIMQKAENVFVQQRGKRYSCRSVRWAPRSRSSGWLSETEHLNLNKKCRFPSVLFDSVCSRSCLTSYLEDHVPSTDARNGRGTIFSSSLSWEGSLQTFAVVWSLTVTYHSKPCERRSCHPFSSLFTTLCLIWWCMFTEIESGHRMRLVWFSSLWHLFC